MLRTTLSRYTAPARAAKACFQSFRVSLVCTVLADETIAHLVPTSRCLQNCCCFLCVASGSK